MLIFDAPPGLRHRHAQSILGGWAGRGYLVRRRARRFLSNARIEIVEGRRGVRLSALVNEHPSDSLGTVVILHGWEGSADSNYMVSVGESVHSAGFDVIRLNFRDHGGSHALNRGLFHSCRIDEVVDAISVIRHSRQARPLHLVGFSLGGNFALRAASHRDAESLGIGRVVAFCPVLRPHSTMNALDTGLWIYREYFLRKWRHSLEAKAAAFPDSYRFGDLRRFRTLTEMTAHFVENYTEFDDLDDYLNGYAIVGDALASLDARASLLITRDDPVIPFDDLADLHNSPLLDLIVLEHGGHCAFLDSYRLRSWADRAAIELLSAE